MSQMPEKIYCIPQSCVRKDSGLYASFGLSSVESMYIRADLHEAEVEYLKQLLRWANDMLLDCRRVLGECNYCDESVGYVCEVCNDNNAILDDIKAALEGKS